MSQDSKAHPIRNPLIILFISTFGVGALTYYSEKSNPYEAVLPVLTKPVYLYVLLIALIISFFAGYYFHYWKTYSAKKNTEVFVSPASAELTKQAEIAQGIDVSWLMTITDEERFRFSFLLWFVARTKTKTDWIPEPSYILDSIYYSKLYSHDLIHIESTSYGGTIGITADFYDYLAQHQNDFFASLEIKNKGFAYFARYSFSDAFASTTGIPKPGPSFW